MSEIRNGADQLRHWREGLGLSLRSAAEQLGVPFATLRRYERGENLPPVDIAVRLREKTGIDVEDWIPTRREGTA